MEMAYVSYQNMAIMWSKLALKMANNPGAQAYGFKQSQIWEGQAKRAKRCFNEAIGRYIIL
jgi:hypothetical protein